MKKILSVLALSLLLLAVKPQFASAECTELYGGGQSCPPSFSFSIQKLVLTPGKGGGNYVNNLSINDPRYSPNQNVSFHLVVKNTSSNTIPTLTVVDTFPQFVSFVSGPGNFDMNNKTLTFTIANLEAGKSVTYTVVGKISDSNIMPSDQGIICLVNQATGTDSNGAASTSSSQFCVQKSVLAAAVPQVLPAPVVTKTPPTGPEMLPLALLFPSGIAGLVLRKKSKINSLFRGGEK